ncbi:putative 2OG-Fe(II) oxygenase superfamily protein [Lyophyllum shimeji]|uniref:2OG-Fe(II) oxygenase superfamily protein n=1 Tax=Lyophyllum shimeji TaxID=47721 RepID=A0A9P3Q098_LYOSH|nr:putative 2OG-Fe(II) oxygenase superfamily protein [Lyophyllum shimeji]
MDDFELLRHRIPGYEAFYIPDYVTLEEEQYLIRKITETPQQKWKQLANRRLQVWGGEITVKNVLLAQEMPPFLRSYPNIMPRLQDTGVFASSPHRGPNHVILNEYLPGQGIMPHEDGPTYHPVVATISLGSHSVFHYYRYNPADAHSPDGTAAPPREGGRSIDATPVLTLFLEPRSLVISRGPMYTSHLHGIRETSQDRISRGDKNMPPTLTDLGVQIANWKMLSGQEAKKAMQAGGVLQRGIRYSLTCRDVERVSCAKPFASMTAQEAARRSCDHKRWWRCSGPNGISVELLPTCTSRHYWHRSPAFVVLTTYKSAPLTFGRRRRM